MASRGKVEPRNAFERFALERFSGGRSFFMSSSYAPFQGGERLTIHSTNESRENYRLLRRAFGYEDETQQPSQKPNPTRHNGVASPGTSLNGFAAAEQLPLSVNGDDAEPHETGIPRLFVRDGASTPSQNIPGITGDAETAACCPVPSEPWNSRDIALYREWLDKCNKTHEHTRSSDMSTLPSRVVDVGCDSASNRLRLHIPDRNEQAAYIAVSHRWNADTDRTKTTVQNLAVRQQSFDLGDLPASFQCAVRAAREIGVRFLWIDSLCIIQGHHLDWLAEARKMESVYTSAYCTMAIYPGEGKGSFDEDVSRSELSRRGWILQERALSRRTIHVCGNQAYWECGSAIWSKHGGEETRPIILVGSSDFPHLDCPGDQKGDVDVLKTVFSHYSTLEFTEAPDRPVASTGLELRLMSAYQTISVYGIVQHHFLPTLLWHRAGDQAMGSFMGPKWAPGVPSWSWMAYDKGAITYRNICSDDLEWKTEPEFDYVPRGGQGTHAQCVLRAPLEKASSACRLRRYDAEGEAERGNREIKDGEDVVGWIGFDLHVKNDISELRFVSLAEGTEGWKDYVGDELWDAEPLPGRLSYVLAVFDFEDKGLGCYRAGIAVVLTRYLSRVKDMTQVL